MFTFAVPNILMSLLLLMARGMGWYGIIATSVIICFEYASKNLVRIQLFLDLRQD